MLAVLMFVVDLRVCWIFVNGNSVIDGVCVFLYYYFTEGYI